MDSPVTIGGIIAAVVVPLVGAIVWTMKWILEKTIPGQQELFTKEQAENRKFFTEQAALDRAAFREEMKALREQSSREHGTILQELRDTKEALVSQTEMLEKMIRHVSPNGKV